MTLGVDHCWTIFCLFFQQQITSFQTEKNRLSLTLEERTEQERAEQSKTLERLEQELEIRGKAEAAAAEAERQRSVLAVDLKDVHQKLDRLQQEYNTLLDKVIAWKNCVVTEEHKPFLCDKPWQRLLFLGHHSLIRHKTQTANIINLRVFYINLTFHMLVNINFQKWLLQFLTKLLCPQ